MSSLGRRARAKARLVTERTLSKRGYDLVRQDDPDRQWRNEFVDESVPLPPRAAEELQANNPRLVELQRAYAALDWPVVVHSRWTPENFEVWLDLARFRGDNSYVWHYRENPRVLELKFFVFEEYIARTDDAGLLDVLTEDGAFGCWTYHYPGRPRCSRDLLDAVNELGFLQRHLGLLDRPGLRVLDVGAGYGRLAHRTVAAAKDVVDYCCVDAIPQSTFLSEWYTAYRGIAPPVRVVALPDVPDLVPGSFDLVCNVHSFSECTLGAITWWLDQLRRLEVPTFFLVPNEPEGFLSLEADGSRLDYLPAIEAAGYRLTVEERAFRDDAVRDLLDVQDRHCLFQREG